jgi:hypothetical protein
MAKTSCDMDQGGSIAWGWEFAWAALGLDMATDTQAWVRLRWFEFDVRDVVGLYNGVGVVQSRDLVCLLPGAEVPNCTPMSLAPQPSIVMTTGITYPRSGGLFWNHRPVELKRLAPWFQPLFSNSLFPLVRGGMALLARSPEGRAMPLAWLPDTSVLQLDACFYLELLIAVWVVEDMQWSV